ncbi:hypothetical protein HanLR1_Chr02g0069571 [Helianthus annuus]|nr:hypothetical protein HanHA89_Chr09g0338541 [Helianthus annuus]KAJ0684274.1 hypothetical protein HanLR1_Chr11g0389371 [Helianthus annuus]KAJ0778246.1 hypothetical protein HanLR1_Chr02g0069571 [Helianthus annuus]
MVKCFSDYNCFLMVLSSLKLHQDGLFDRVFMILNVFTALYLFSCVRCFFIVKSCDIISKELVLAVMCMCLIWIM